MNIVSPLKKAHWPWPKMDIEEVAKQARNQNIYMPNIGFVHVDIHDNWKVTLGDAANSKQLWLNSLVSAHACLEHGIQNGSSTFIEVGTELINGYFQQCPFGEGIFQYAWQDEHAVANRLFVITAFLHYASNQATPNASVIIKNIIKFESLLRYGTTHAEWLNNDSHYIKNNHGVMMDLALAQYSLFMRSVDGALYKKYLETISRRLKMMFDLSFDKDGCCTENSPTYHFVNYALFSTILEFLKNYSLIENPDEWQDRLKKVREVGNLLLRSDGSIPLIGDSEIKPGTFFPQPDHLGKKYGIGYYPEAGFFIASSPDFHLTLRGGGTSYSHRHIDDLSLTLQVKGKDFIVDCGMYNYDIQDKMRRWFISSRAHSGIYLESMGDIRFANFNSPQAMSRFISAEGDESKFSVRARHNLSKEVEVERFLLYENSILTIEDSFDCDIEQDWRIQFNLHPDVKVKKLENQSGYSMTNDGVVLQIRHNNYSGIEDSIQIELINYSPKFMQLNKAQSLIIKGRGKSLEVMSVIKLNEEQ